MDSFLAGNSTISGALLKPIRTDGKKVYPISSAAARGSNFHSIQLDLKQVREHRELLKICLLNDL